MTSHTSNLFLSEPLLLHLRDAGLDLNLRAESCSRLNDNDPVSLIDADCYAPPETMPVAIEKRKEELKSEKSSSEMSARREEACPRQDLKKDSFCQTFY